MSLQVHLYVTVSQILASNVRMYDNGSLRACLHGRGLPGEGGGGGGQVGEVIRLGGVTRLSIQSLILI